MLFVLPHCARAAEATTRPAEADAFADVEARIDALHRARMSGGAAGAEVERVLGEIVERLEAMDARAEGELQQALRPARGTPPATVAARREELRTLRCRIAISRADAALAAAGAVAPNAPQRPGWIDEALEQLRSLRVTYKDLPASLMGYIHESRAHRLGGDLESARAVLEPALDLTRLRRNPFEAELQRIARMESLEITLRESPDRAAVEARQWLESADIRGDESWTARASWLLARALAAPAVSTRPAENLTQPDLERVLMLVRDPSVVWSVPPLERLAFLARVDAASGRRSMTGDEVLDWAGLLAAAGRADAADWYARAREIPGDAVPPEHLLRYAQSLWKQERFADAVAICDEILGTIAVATQPAGSSEAGLSLRSAAAQLKAVCLQALYRKAEAGLERDRLRAGTLDALQALIMSDAPEQVRRASLRSWVALQAEASGVSACMRMLDSHREWIDGDAYLMYADAAARWEDLRRRVPTSAPATRDAGAGLAPILESLQAAQELAAPSELADIAARAAILRARILAAPPLSDCRAALSVLDSAARAITASPSAVADAARCRVECLLELGMPDEAEAALEGMSASPAESSRLLLSVAGEFVRRLPSDQPIAGDTRERIVRLCRRAWEASLRQDPSGPAGADAARLMLDVGAAADAESVAKELLQRRQNADRQARLEAALLVARALHEQQRTDDAAAMYEDLAARHPDAPELLMARGAFELSLSNPAGAAEQFRRARSLLEPGTTPWCEATLELAEALSRQGSHAAASEILRVAGVLYPDFGTPELRGRLARARNGSSGARESN